MTLAELLPLLVRPLGAPVLPAALPKAASNVTAGSPPAPTPPPMSSPAQWLAALGSLNETQQQNELRKAQAEKIRQQLEFGKQLPGMIERLMGAAGTETPAFGALAPAAAAPVQSMGGGMASALDTGNVRPSAPVQDMGGGFFSALGRAVEKVESNHNPLAVSKAGARGLRQIMPGTAAQYGVTNPDALFDPALNRKVGDTILADLLKRYNGDLDAALVGYNAGPGRADKWLAAGRDPAVLPAETRAYIPKVRAQLAQYGATDAPDAGRTQLAQADGSFTPPAQGQQSAPVFGSLAPGMPKMSPLERQMISLGIMSRGAGMGDVVQPLEQWFYNSPQFKAQQRFAEKGVDLHFEGPMEAEKRRAGLPFFQLEQTIQSDLQRRNQLAQMGLEYAPDGKVRPIENWSAANAANKAAETAAVEAAKLPIDQQRKFYETQLGIAGDRNKPVTLSPGQTYQVPNVAVPAPPGVLVPGGALQSAAPPGAPGQAVLQGRNPAEVEFEQTLGRENAKAFQERRAAALAASTALANTQRARELLDKGVITGTGAQWRLNAWKALATAGIGGENVANTEAYVASRAQDVLNLVKGLGAGVSISNADREFAEGMAAGRITVTEKGMRRTLDILDDVGRQAITKFNKDAEKVPAGLSPYPLTVEMPKSNLKPIDDGTAAAARDAIAKGAPRDAVIQRLRQNGIDPSGL